MTNLRDILIDSASVAIQNQHKNGSMPAGNNGPWDDEETPVRNTSHWLITFSYAYQKSGRRKFLHAANAAVEFLQSKAARPYGETFHYRKSVEKDQCSGLIGQAWSIEALCCAAKNLSRPELAREAEEVFLKHPFISNLKCWRTVEIDGTPKRLDFTLNHQLWFAAAGGLVTKFDSCSRSVEVQIEQFLDELPTIMSTYDNGLIHHVLKPGFRPLKQGALLLENARALRVPKPILSIRDHSISSDMRRKAIGYHSFNLYAFALLYEVFPEHSIWESSLFRNALEYAFSDQFSCDLEGNPYGYPYNCSGIEMAFIGEQFGLKTDAIDTWLNTQLSAHYDREEKLMNQNTDDPITLAARLYEATRLDTESRYVWTE